MSDLAQQKEWLKEINRGINYKSMFREQVGRSWLGEEYDNRSEKEVLAYLKDRKKTLTEEIAFAEAINKINNLLETIKISVYCFGDFVDERDSIRFIKPFLFLAKVSETDKLIEFLQTKKLHCQIQDRNSHKKAFHVFYSGYLENDMMERLEFDTIDNGFCVNLG